GGEHASGAANAAIVVDHAEARHNAVPRIGHLCAERLARELSNSFSDTEMSTSRAGLSDRQLAARGVERKASLHFKGVGANKSRPLAFAAETQALKFQHIDHRVVVIGFEEVDILRPDARLRV